MRRDTLFWGGLLILLGVLFLLDNAGLLGDIEVWGLFWPFFLIFLGLWILINFVIRPSKNIEHLKIPVGDKEKAKIRFDHAAGRLVVKAGDQEELVAGKFGGGVEFSQEMSGSQADIRFKMPQRWFPFFWFPGSTSAITWEVELKRNYPLMLSLNTGAGEIDLDLSDLNVQEVVLKTGASATKIILPANAGYTSLHIEAGVASVDVHVPVHVAARIRTDVGLSSVHIDRERFPRQGGIYVSEDYDTAGNKVDIEISSGVSSVSVT